jgi:AAA+ superfamily predicted ATPase
MFKYLNKPFEKNPIVAEFLKEYEEIYDILTNDKYNTNNSTKYTIFLWDNAKLNDYIRKVMNYYDYNLHQKLERIINTIKHHIAKFHHITQSIVSNDVNIETLANKKIRLSIINVENVSLYIFLIFHYYYLIWHPMNDSMLYEQLLVLRKY